MNNLTYETTPLAVIPKNGLVLEFPEVSSAQAGLYAEELETDLKNSIQDNNVHTELSRIRTNSESQDIGTVIALVLGANSVIAIAQGIAKWMNRHNQATINIKLSSGDKIKICGLNSIDVEKILKNLNI